ncbi:MAG: hypothetical protein DRQ62_15475 [Gammaproteobacteria bacterium]|nr:MAG: hypothetical protein DRQ62_15475 [Gammaproteobacteria bacterium]
MNIKVTLRKALQPNRSENKQSQMMTVLSVVKTGEKYTHKLTGTHSKMTKVLAVQYAVGDLLVVSDGEVVGRSKKEQAVFYV